MARLPAGWRFKMTLTQVLEALLFSAQKPLTIRELKDALSAADDHNELPSNQFTRLKEPEIAAALSQLKSEHAVMARGFQLVEKADGWQLLSHPDRSEERR